MIDLHFTFTAQLWMYQGKGAWFFITLPQEDSAQIKFFHPKRRGWGSVRVKAQIGATSWETSIFPDSKANTYILPVKAEVRKKEKLEAGEAVTVSIAIPG